MLVPALQYFTTAIGAGTSGGDQVLTLGVCSVEIKDTLESCRTLQIVQLDLAGTRTAASGTTALHEHAAALAGAVDHPRSSPGDLS